MVLKDEVLGQQDALPACHLLSVLLSTATVFKHSPGLSGIVFLPSCVKCVIAALLS